MKKYDLIITITVIFALSVLIVMFVFVSLSQGEKIELQWDYNDPQEPDGFRIYSRTTGGQYDYNSALPTIEYPDGNIPPEVRAVTVDLPGEQNAAVKYEFVARAYVVDLNSDDSNQVDYIVVRIPPPKPIDLTGEFNRRESLIHIEWTQPQDDYITNHWRVYYKLSEQEASEYTELGLIRKDNPLQLTTSFNVVGQGEHKSVDFVVVAYRRSGAWSGNSQTLTIDVDRRQPGPVENLRINIEIPVV